MNTADLQRFKDWFEGYARSFLVGNEEDRLNITLKIEHTHRVRDLAAMIAREETADRTLALLAEAAGLFHDVGRFPQYARYKTFRDSISVNHGRLGAETLISEKVFGDLPAGEQEIILEAVRFHNAFSIADLDDPPALFCLKLVRDADKLDIWRIFLEFYEKNRGGMTDVIGLGLPDIPEYSDEVVAAIKARKTASLSALKSLNDFMLLQLSWIFDLNFRPSVRILLEREIIERIVPFLPRTEEIKQVSRILDDYAREQLKKPGSRLT
jgi:putative nucleotidyltransferase with HDIG domain